MDPFSDMGSTPISSTILQKAMRDFKPIAHGFFIRIFPQGVRWLLAWLAGLQASENPLRPKAHKKWLPGYFARQPLLRWGYCAAALLCSGTDHLVIWKERVMGAA